MTSEATISEIRDILAEVLIHSPDVRIPIEFIIDSTGDDMMVGPVLKALGRDVVDSGPNWVSRLWLALTVADMSGFAGLELTLRESERSFA